ncbi:uncharacterized protein LOC129614093 isoform X1 [Condylostylus longicornis]|uniref:uncharacterized protein LOC129614093 isoform X1 n=1 Tax=Condylostylus longicornis TaxID=2530218 RepID=UPI00244DF6F4|nr:uncharacterized protein LOC129614093 isoform X1 [Condylostylus longicornis]
MERRRNTLDRLQDQIRLNFGRRSSPSPTQQEKQRKSAEKSEKLRELTELLRGTSSTSSHSNRFSPTPPPIPPPRKPRHGSQQSSFEKSTEKLPPDPGPPPSPISPLRAADSEDILPMDQEAEDEPHRYSAPQLTSSTNNREKIVQSPSPPPLPPPPPPPLPPQPLFSTQSTININLKSKKHKENKPLTGSTHDSIENNNKSLLMSSLRPNSSVSNLEAFIFGRNGRGKSKSPPPYTALLTKSTSKDESTSTEDDICTSLPKPESRTIIGSYTQKGIPYRSASFSQVDYSSGKYVKSALNAFRERFRKSQDKNQSDSGGDNNAIILSRKKDDQESEETKPKEPDFIYIPLKKSELNINLRYDENEKPSLENRVNPPEIIMEEDSQISELDSPMRTEADCSEDISEASDSVIVPTTILEDKSDENQNKIFPKSSPINVSREGSATSELTNSNEKDLLMESPPDKVKTTTTCLIPIPIYESTDVVTTESKDNVTEDSVSTEGIPTVLNEESNNDAEKAHETHLNADSPDNVPRISVSQNTPQGSIDEEAESPNIAAEINPERLSVEQTFDDQPTVPTLVEEVLNRPLEFTEVKKRYSNEAAIGDRSHSADSILSRGGSSDEKRKRDKSKRRMGLYFQWPAVETSENTQTSSEWDTSIDSTAFEDKNNLALDITKVDFSNLKSDSSQNDTLSLFLNDTLNQSELIQTPESGYICEISTPESESYIKPKIWSRFNRRTSLTCQSSEEKDDGSSPAPSVNRSNRNLLCFKNDSTSDNESDRTPPPSRDRTSPSPAPGDSDFKRYSKRPLRGPYGQMLEAEMKKPGKVHYDEIFEELKENDNLGKTHGNRSRIQNNRSFDETRTIPQHSNSMRVRKTANLPIPTHTRAASTPSQMESTSSSPGSNRISSKDIVGSLEESNGHLTKGKSNKKYSNDMHRERSPKRASSEAPDIKLINFAKRSPSSASDRHQFLQDKSQKRSFEEMRFSQSSRTNSERSTISESSKSGGGSGVVNNQTNIGTLMPSPELLAALLKGSSERQISEQRQQTIVDTRNHIVEEIYRTEASYVDALTTIVTKYYNVLKTPESAGLIDTKAVDEIFFMTTELLSIHKKYYNDLKSKSDPLDPTLCCESFLETFSQTEVLETYTCFVNNRDRAHEAVKTAVQARPAFGKFLESTAREQKGKLTLDNLLIKPIQKFVNYEMLFTRLLKHTDSDIDQKPIQDVLKLVHDILVHLDCKKKEINENGQREDALRQYETYIEGISDLVAPERQFLIYDLVQLPSNHTSNHMRGLFLFSDLLVLTSIKRRSGAIKKQDFRSNTSTLDITFASTLENIKYKFLRKFPIEYVEIVKTQDENARRIEKDYEQLVDDRNKIQQIDQIQTSIKFQSALHQVLEQTIRNYLSEVETRLTECERQLNDGQLNSLKFMINIPGDSQHVTVLFSKAERRAKWEEIFNDAKQKLAACLERHPTPEFLRSIALRKTRAGLQFTCAAPTLTDQKDVWVCNSDGYIGQVAVLSIQENPPTVSSCNGVCNARILCIASVPAYKETKSQSRQSSTEEPPQSCRNSSSSDNSKKTSSSSNTTATTTTTVTANIKESNSMPAGISTGSDLNEIQLDSNSSSDDSDPEQLGNISGTNNETNISGNVNVGGNQINTILDSNNITNPENRISSPIPKTISSMSNLSTIHHQHQDSNSEDMESQQSTMWLGTEDGCIHVYNSTDNIRIKKNKIKIEHLSSVYSILYYDNRVFVSLANGDICVYLRDNVGWNTSHPLCISIGTVSSPVNKLLNVNGKLWCTIQGTIKVLDTKTLQVESTIQISSDSKPITNMAICNNCVWISIQNSAVIKCFHSTSHELIFEVNLAPSVNKMLSNCDDIIRQHKAACLRVTSLLACKDLIWIGTSAGVLLTIPAQSYIKGQTNNIPIVTGIPHGHTGHVRFLTSVESNIITATSSIISSDNQEFDTISSNNSYNLNNNNNNNNNYNNNNNNNSIGNSNTSNNRSNSRTRSEIGSSNNLNSSSMTTSKYSSKSVDSSLDRKSKRNTIHNTKDKTKAEAGKTLIISGGDGYENFGNSNSNSPSEIAGREDSTNHLLLWQI